MPLRQQVVAGVGVEYGCSPSLAGSVNTLSRLAVDTQRLCGVQRDSGARPVVLHVDVEGVGRWHGRRRRRGVKFDVVRPVASRRPAAARKPRACILLLVVGEGVVEKDAARRVCAWRELRYIAAKCREYGFSVRVCIDRRGEREGRIRVLFIEKGLGSGGGRRERVRVYSRVPPVALSH